MAFISDEERKRILAQMLSGQLMRPPPPVQATPGNPLPGVPLQVPVVAPQSEQAMAQPYDEFAAVKAAIGQQRPVTLTGNAQIDAILQSRQATQQAGAKTMMDILAAARMNPEEQAIIADRRARNQKELEQLDADKKRAGWEALARAGLKMAQSNSPYFVQALASGMEAGVEGLNEAKLKRDEKRSRLQAAEEDARLAEIRGKQSAQDRALSVYNAALAAGKTADEAERLARKDAEELATLPQRLEMANLEVEGKRLDNKLTAARTVDALRGSSGGGGGGGDGTPGPKRLPPGAKAEAQGRLATAYSEQDEAYRDWVAAGKPILGKVKEGSDEWAAASKYEAARGKVNNILNILGEKTLGPAPTRTGGSMKRVTQAQRSAGQPRPAAATPARPAGVGADWTLQKDAKGRRAWVSPDGNRFKEVS